MLLPNTSYGRAEEISRGIDESCGSIGVSQSTATVECNVALGVATRHDTETPLLDVVKRAQDRMYKNKLLKSESARSSIITSLTQTLHEKSFETERHTKRLRVLAQKVGQVLNLHQNQLDDLALLGRLHDIGKPAIPEKILRKPGDLTPEEWDTVKKHPEIGYRIVQSSPQLASIAEGVLAHHEWWNGRGYPQGLKGEEIPLISRIISVVDAYDVMINGRPYQGPKSPYEALRELNRCSGHQFDPRVVRAFEMALDSERDIAGE